MELNDHLDDLADAWAEQSELDDLLEVPFGMDDPKKEFDAWFKLSLECCDFWDNPEDDVYNELDALRGLPEPNHITGISTDKGGQPSQCFKWGGGFVKIDGS